MITPIIILLTFCIAGIVSAVAEVEKSKRMRIILLSLGSLLFLVSGFFLGVLYGG